MYVKLVRQKGVVVDCCVANAAARFLVDPSSVCLDFAVDQRSAPPSR